MSGFFGVLQEDIAERLQDALAEDGFILEEVLIRDIDLPDQKFSPKLYLEVQSQLTRPGDASDPVAEWPFNANPPKKKTKR